MICRHSRQVEVEGKEDTTIYLMCERIHFKSDSPNTTREARTRSEEE